MFKNKKLWALIALIWVVIIIIPHEVPNYTDDTDFPWTYVPAAQGVKPDPYHGFVYPLVLKGAYFIWGDWILAGREPDDSARTVGLPLLEGRTMTDGRPTAYVCESHTCSAPVTDPCALAAQLGDQ